jgi:hypothetical protein
LLAIGLKNASLGLAQSCYRRQESKLLILTTSSSNKRKVQRARPLGGSEQEGIDCDESFFLV